jgi:hypothetical protein
MSGNFKMSKLLGIILLPLSLILWNSPLYAHDAKTEVICAGGVINYFLKDKGILRYTASFAAKNTTNEPIGSVIFKLRKKDGTQIGLVNFGGKYSAIKNGVKPGKSFSDTTMVSSVAFSSNWSEDSDEKKSQIMSYKKLEKEMNENIQDSYCTFVSFAGIQE